MLIPLIYAKENNLKHYYTGKPCKHGHNSKRLTSDRSCCECKNSRQVKRRSIKENIEKERFLARLAWSNNPEAKKNKKEKDKIRRSTEKFKLSQNEKDRKKYIDNEEYRLIKIKMSSNFYAKNKESIRKRKNKWFQEKYKKDVLFRIKHNIRSITSRVIKLSKEPKESKTFDLLCYSAFDFKTHIEKQFEKGMSWNNHGDWHIDHITPISKMIQAGITDVEKINCLSNLRPIWKELNFKKSDSIEFLL